MRSRHLDLALTLAAAALATGSLPGGASLADPAPQARSSTTASTVQTAGAPASVSSEAGDFDRWWRSHPSTHRSGYPNGPGWSNRHVQRMARKRRNVQRNRKAHRG